MIDSATVRMSGEPAVRIGGVAERDSVKGRSLSWVSGRRAESRIYIYTCLSVNVIYGDRERLGLYVGI
jgi:hypothetical protein